MFAKRNSWCAGLSLAVLLVGLVGCPEKETTGPAAEPQAEAQKPEAGAAAVDAPPARAAKGERPVPAEVEAKLAKGPLAISRR